MRNARPAGTTVLLGAGASVDAGIPVSVDLTKKIAETIDTPSNRYNKTAHALNVAIGAMVAHDTAHGRAAFAGIDVERIFAAVRMLARRDELDIAPYVAAWNQHLEQTPGEGNLPSSWAHDFGEAIRGSGHSFASRAEQGFRDGVNALTRPNSRALLHLWRH